MKKKKDIKDLFKYINSRKYVPNFIEVPKLPGNSDSYENYFLFSRLEGAISSFTEGEIYFCKNPHDLEVELNFIDNNGSGNGFSPINHKYFAKVSKQQALLHFARKLYPVGARFKTIFGNSKVLEINNIDFEFLDNPNATNNLRTDYLDKGTREWATVYCDQKGWAEIITS